jgi:hypothetical protein
MGAVQLRILHHGVDIGDAYELRNGRSNPFGWSYHEIFAKDDFDQMVQIGVLYCGEPKDFIDGFSFELVPVDEPPTPPAKP